MNPEAFVNKTVQAKNLFRRGLFVREIAREVGLHRETISFMLREAQVRLRTRREAKILSLKRKREPQPDIEQDEIRLASEIITYNNGTLNYSDDHSQPAQDNDDIVNLYQSGNSQKQVAELTGKTQSAVYRHLRRQGIKAREACQQVHVDPATKIKVQGLNRAIILGRLSDNELEVIQKRYLYARSQGRGKIAKALGVTKPDIAYVERMALTKLGLAEHKQRTTRTIVFDKDKIA